MSAVKKARSGTFVDNMKLPVHRWFRYSAGFSADWVRSVIADFEKRNNQHAIVFDPFAGSGTTVFAASAEGRGAYGVEGHPFVAKIAEAKTYYYLNVDEYLDACRRVLSEAHKLPAHMMIRQPNDLLNKCYTEEALCDLERLRQAYYVQKDDSPIWKLVWLNLTSILRISSQAGTAQWQYVLPNKSKSKVVAPYEAFVGKSELMAADMVHAQQQHWARTARIDNHDMRIPYDCAQCNLLVTSPPYPNNYDYADATRLEMTFWGEIDSWGDLKNTVRPYIMRSCSQHSSADRVKLEQVLSKSEIAPIADELTPVVHELDRVRHGKGGKKTYHTMIAAYFLDLAKILQNSSELLSSGAEACFVIGDSAPYGVHVPAERWLGKLAEATGFTDYKFEKLRDRNVKWDNRTHKVPLLEGRVWMKKARGGSHG